MTINMMQLLEHPVSAKAIRYAPRAAALLCLLLIAAASAKLFWSFLTPEAQLPQATTAANITASNPGQSIDFASQVANLHIFGTPAVAEVVEVEPEEAPETRSNLKLRGVFALNEKENGLALISNGNGPEEVYQVDDNISRSTKLAAVYPDRVMLSINGKYETLRLPETKDTGVSLVSTPSSRPSGNRNTASQAPTGGVTKTLGEYRKEFLRNPTTIARLVNVSPASDESGNTIGYKVSANGKHPAFDQLGIQDGDVVTSINGIQLDSTAKGMSAFQALRQAQQVTVQILRNGQPSTLNLTF